MNFYEDMLTNMIQERQRNSRMDLPCEKYKKLHEACMKYPTIQLTADGCYQIAVNNSELEKGPSLVKKIKNNKL